MKPFAEMTLQELAKAYDFGHGFTRGHVMDELSRRQRMFDAMDGLHQAIVNIRCRPVPAILSVQDYMNGHRDARHDAAELVAAAYAAAKEPTP